MFYILLSGIIVTIAGIRSISFGFWQMQQKNVVGGIAVWILSAVSIILGWLAMVQI